jgi:hypothetical protein
MAVHLTAQQQADLASLAYELGHNPQTRKDLAKLVKKINPERAARSFRDVEQDDKFEAFKSEIEDKVDLKGARAAKSKQDEQKQKLAERYDEKQLAGIEEVATKFGLSDLDAAAVLYAHEHPESDPALQPPAAHERPGATWEFPTVRGRDGKEMDFKSFAADPRTHSLNAAYNIITEFKNNKLSPAFSGRR